MEFLDDGVEKKMFDFQVDITNEERAILLKYAKENIPEDVLEALYLNWAFVDIIEEAIKRQTSNQEV